MRVTLPVGQAVALVVATGLHNCPAALSTFTRRMYGLPYTAVFVLPLITRLFESNVARNACGWLFSLVHRYADRTRITSLFLRPKSRFG